MRGKERERGGGVYFFSLRGRTRKRRGKRKAKKKRILQCSPLSSCSPESVETTAAPPMPPRAGERAGEPAERSASVRGPAGSRQPRRVGTGAKASRSILKKRWILAEKKGVSLFLFFLFFAVAPSIAPCFLSSDSLFSSMARLQALRSALRSLSQQSSAALRQGGGAAAAAAGAGVGGAAASSGNSSGAASAIALARAQQVRFLLFLSLSRIICFLYFLYHPSEAFLQSQRVLMWEQIGIGSSFKKEEKDEQS